MFLRGMLEVVKKSWESIVRKVIRKIFIGIYLVVVY